MAIKTRQPELLVSFNEYVDTWVQLIQEYYNRGVSSDDIFVALQLDEEKSIQFSMELCTVLLILATRTWNAKRLKEGSKELVASAMVENTYKALFSVDEEALAVCQNFYQSKYAAFAQLLPEATSEKEIRNQLIGFSRYIVSQCSQRPEEENAGIIEHLSILLIAAAASFKRFTQNTTLDGNSAFIGTPKFLVKK